MKQARTLLFAAAVWLDARDHGPYWHWRKWRHAWELAKSTEPLNRHSCLAYMIHCWIIGDTKPVSCEGEH